MHNWSFVFGNQLFCKRKVCNPLLLIKGTLRNDLKQPCFQNRSEGCHYENIQRKFWFQDQKKKKNIRFRLDTTRLSRNFPLFEAFLIYYNLKIWKKINWSMSKTSLKYHNKYSSPELIFPYTKSSAAEHLVFELQPKASAKKVKSD